MSPLPLLLVSLLVLQLPWSPEASAEVEQVSGVGLNLLQDEFRRWATLPGNISSTVLAEICRIIVDLKIAQPRVTPNMESMSLLLHQDACHNISIPLKETTDLWNTPGFDRRKPTVIFITGYRSNINNSNSGPVAKAFACRGDTNFLVLDAANFLESFYAWSALNTDAIGHYLAKALLKLNRRYVTRNVHLVGHSLGAQIAGATGRHFTELSGGATLARVTGLDPANPCFYDGKDSYGVRSGDAAYVDIIISNPGVAGAKGEFGDGNFFVEGLRPIKSSCRGLDAISCSHQRAVDYFTESVYPNNELNFRGRSCPTFVSLLTGNLCSRVRTATMGYVARRRGLYYVDANKEEPFGTEADPLTFTYSNSTCGLCNSE